MEQRLSLITLGVADLARSIAFYEGLGWQRAMPAAQGVAFFQLGGIGLALYPLRSLAYDAGLDPAPPPAFRGIALAHNVRLRDEVDRVVDRLAELGGTVLAPARDMDWGGRAGFVADPDGHLWEIAWNPLWPLDAAGNVAIPG